MDEQVNPLERDHCLCVVLPCGQEKTSTVHGSYHLNPSDYTVEVLSHNKNNISFKPNCPVGLLEAEKIVLKPKNMEEKVRRPYMPETTVRLLVNYNKSHKTVVRVNPRLPLEVLLPVVCEKCEFQVDSTILLKDCQSKETLDLSKTLNELGLREVFAKDLNKDQPNKAKTRADTQVTEVISPTPLQAVPKREKKQKENSGFFSLFRRRKKKQDVEDTAVSAPSTPGLSKHVDSEGVSGLAAEIPKKRRAPQPPISASQSVPNNLSGCHLGGAQRSAESTLRSTKRRAPPPPCAPSQQEVQPDSDGKGTHSDESDSVNVSLSSSSSPHPSQPPPSFCRPSLAHLHEVADPFLPSFRGKDLSDARSALAKVLTSSVSRGTLVRRLKNSASFPKFQNGSPFLSMRASENQAVQAELQSVLNSDLSVADSEWEDPVQRRGLTTFKVVPPKKVQDPDVSPDQCQTPEREVQPEAEEEMSLKDRLSSTTSLRPEPCPQETQVPPPALQDLGSANTPQSERRSENHQGLDPEDTPQSDTHQGLDSEDTPQSEDTSETHQGLESEDISGTHKGVDSTNTPQSERKSETHQGLDPEDIPQSEDTSETHQGLDSEDIPQSETHQSLDPDDVPQSEDTSETHEGLGSTNTPKSEKNSETHQDLDSTNTPQSEDTSETHQDLDPEDTSETHQDLDSTNTPQSEDTSETHQDLDYAGLPQSEGEPTSEKLEVEEEEEPEVILPVPPDGDFTCESLNMDECSSDTEEEKKEEEMQEEEEEEEEEEVEEEEEEEVSFPSPPPPVFFDEDTQVMDEEEGPTASSPPQTQTLLCALSVDQQEDSAGSRHPVEKKSSAPSRFAQAVAMAVQRSRLHGRSKSSGDPRSALQSPPRSTYQYGA